MKTRISLRWAFAVALSAASISAAAAQDQLQLSPNSSASAPLRPPSLAARENTNSITRSLPPGDYVSPWLMDVIKLAQSRIDDSIMLMFIDSAGTFNLDPDQIIYLRDLGLPAEIITGMIQHDIEIVSGLRQMPLSPSPSPATVHLNFVQSEPIEKPPQPLPPAPAPTLTAVTVAPLNSAPPLTPEGPRPDELTFSHQAELPTAPRMLSCQSQSSLSRQIISPVRQPYPVQLIDPIIMVRGQGRTPNLVVIELGP